MRNTNNECLLFENLDTNIKNRIILFKKLLNNLDTNDSTLKNLGYEIVDSKILLDLIKSCFKNKNKSQLNIQLEDCLSKEVNRYSEFEKYLRNKEYFTLYKIEYSFDSNNNLSTVQLDNKNKSSLNDFFNKTNLFRNIIKTKIFKQDKNNNLSNIDKFDDINIDLKEIFKDLINVNIDDEHFNELNEIINIKKRIVYLKSLINSCKIISNLNIEELFLSEEIIILFHLFTVECSTNLIIYENELNSSIDKIQNIIQLYNSKKMDIEDDTMYDIYSDINISEDERKILNYYFEMYKSNTNKDNNISFITYLKSNFPMEKELIKLVEALNNQFNTVYSEYLIYKTPYVNTDLCITFEQFAKKKYGINNVSKKY